MKDYSKTNKLRSSIGILLLGALFIVACQPTAAQPTTSVATNAPLATTAPTNTPAPTNTAVVIATQSTQAAIPATGGEATINVADNPKLGKILVDGNGMTLYMYTKDGPNQSTCSGQCAKAWPPLLTQGHPTLGEGVDASLIGTAMLADGTMIVTYNKMPLYLWYKDLKPGDTTGQGNKQVWYVVSPDGTAVGMPTPTPNSASSSSTDSGGYNYNP